MTPLTAKEKNVLADKVFDLFDDTPTADRLDILLSLITSEVTTLSVDLRTQRFSGERFVTLTAAVYNELNKSFKRIFLRLSDPTEAEMLFQDFAEALAKKEGIVK